MAVPRFVFVVAAVILAALTAFAAIPPASALAAAPVCPDPVLYAIVGEEATVNATCTDSDGDALSYTLPTTTQQNGYPITADGPGPTTLRLTVPNSYNPDYDSHLDQFGFQACDNTGGGCDLGSVAVSIDIRPVCNGATPVSAKNHVGTIIDLDAYCTDPDHFPGGNQLEYVIAQQPAHGTLSGVAADGRVTYTPAASFTGADSFKIQADDERVLSAEKTVTVNVAANVAPTCLATSASVDHDTAKTITLTCADSDGDALTLGQVNPPEHGTLINFTANSVTYAPSTGYSGADSFTYKANDDFGGVSAPATVSLTVAAGASSSPTPISTTTPTPGPTPIAAPAFDAGFAALLGGAARSAAKVDAGKPVLKLGTFDADLCPSGCAIGVLVTTGASASGAVAAKATTLGKATITVPKGVDTAVKVKLNAAAKRLLKRKKKLKVSVAVAIRDALTGESRTTTRKLTLKVKKRR